jgi:OmpA-OmpF porin, OOP family
MSFNLIDAAKQIFSSDLVSKASSYLGESEGGISKAISGIIPSLLGGIADKASSSEGASHVASLAQEADHSGLLSQASAFAGSDDGGLLSKGAGMLSGLLGDNKTSMLGGLLSQFAGVKSSSITSLLGMAAPALLGLIGKHASGNNLDAGGISSFLSSQKSNIAAAMPAGLDLGSLFGSFSGAKTPEVVSHATNHFKEEATEKKGGAMGMLLPLLLLVLAGAAAWYFFKDGCKKKVDTSEVTAAIDTAGSTIKENATAALQAIAGKLDSVSGDFVYDLGENVTLDLPDGAKLTVGKNSTEYKLVSFLNDKSALLDTVKGNWFEFTNVRFKTGGSEITEASMDQLNNMVAIAKGFPAAQFKVGGYTDNTGNPAANIALSQKRADAVSAMLKKLGVAAAALTGAKGYGQEWPLADNGTAEGRAQNRRVAVNVKAK